MVKAIQINEFGGPEVLQWVEVDVPSPGPGQLLVRHTFSGLNFIDVQVRKGSYPVLPQLPAILGAEASGIVESIGEGVNNFSVGQRVVYASTYPGAYSESRLINADVAVSIPESISDEDAAASFLKGCTAEYLVNRCYPVKSGEVALVHAAAGGVGLFLCQWLKELGVTVIGTVGSDEKKDEILSNGANFAVNYRSESFKELSLDVTEGRGVSVVYDSVGPDVYSDSIDSLRPRGYMVNFGNSSGPLEPIDPVELNVIGSLFFTKPSMRFYQLDRKQLEESSNRLFDVMERKAVRAVIGQKYALSEAHKAHIDVEARRTIGSTLLVC